MEGNDELLEPLRSFTARSLRCDSDRWREFVSEEENQVTFNSFFNTQDYTNLFICQDTESGLSVSLDVPKHITTKVICVSKTGREGITKENCRKMMIQEVRGGDILSFITSVCEQVICPLLSNPETSRGWAVDVAKEALTSMERQKNEALVTKAQIEGLTFLPHYDAVLHHDDLHGSAVDDDAVSRKLLHACESTIIEWAELVSQFLQQDSSQPLLDGQKPLPSEEFMFWKNRLKNLKFIQEQLMSSRGQQVASIVQRTDSVYWATLRDIYRDVQEGVMEAEDVTLSLSPLQEKLEELQQVEYEQLGANMAAMMEEIRLIWIRSEFYCRGCRMVVLLQEICNLFIHTSRKFLCGQEVMRGLVSRPARVLDDVKLVIRTLQTLKEVYSQCRTQLEDQSQDGRRHSWDFPSHLAFVHLDNFLTCVDSIQEALCVVLQLLQLDRAVLSGVSSRMWTEVVQDIYQDFLGHVTVLSSSNCDPTDPDDQSFQLHLDQFTAQVSHLERRLVCVLSRALKDCYTSSSAAELLQMFRFVLGRPLIRDLLRPQLIQLVDMVLRELDETELLFYTQRQKPETSNRFSPSAATRLRWTQELQQRAEDAVDSYRTVHEMYPESGESQLVLQRFEQVVDVLQDFRDQVRTDWSHQLDSDCGFVLEQPLIQQEEQGMLGVPCSHKLEDVLRELRYASREPDVQLRPLTARLFACRDDIRQTYLCLGHMVSCYNQVLRDVLQVELPLIQDQLQDLNQSLSELQETSWSCADVQRLVEQQRHKVLKFHSTVSEARDNMVAMTTIIQGWAELHLLRRSGDSLLEGGATEQSYRRIREEGQQLLRLTQANRRLYGADASSESWIRYLDHVDQQVEDGLFQLLLRSLNFLCDNMKPQSCSVLFSVRLQLQETGSVFEPSVGVGLCDIIKNIISDVYSAASLPPRISESHHGNYQVSLQQSPVLCVLEQEVMRCLQQVSAEAELVRAGLDRYSSLWQRNKTDMMQEFLSYSRQLGPDELDADEAPPTLTDFQREIETLRALSRDVSRLDDVITVHGWLQVDVRPFRDALISLIHDWTHLYTQHLVDSVRDSLLQVTQRADNNDNEESPSSSRLPLTDTIVLLEAAGVQLPEHLAAQLQC